ncbi:MAG: hypothetical protein KAR13_20070, partial [Desulfobulbaceae bacterium]|nr:hypothetical protein [Desulfobulbaceae bacterium]
QNFAEEIDRLEEIWTADKILIAFLKILRALGQYIAKKKARAHPNSVKLLYSVYNALEKVVLAGDMPGSQKKEIVAHELRKYTKLKKQFDIATSSADKPGKVEKSKIVTRDQEVAAPEVEMAPAVQPQPLPGQVPEPDKEPVSEAIPAVEGDKMPAALDVEEMDEQMETEVVGLDITPVGKTSGPMEEEMCEAQPFSSADELQAKTHLGLLDQKGSEAEPSSQVKEIIPELSKKISFAEIDNRLDEFFDEEPAEEVRQEAAAPPPLEVPVVELQVEDLLVDEVKVPASEAGKKVTPEDEAELKPELMEEEKPAAVAVAEEEVSVEDAVVPLATVSEKAGEAAVESLEVDSRLDDLFGEGDEIPGPDKPEEQ